MNVAAATTTPTITALTRKLAKDLVAAHTTTERVFFRRGEIPSLEGLAPGDIVAVWQDGDRSPWIGTVDGVHVAKGEDVVSLAGFTGPQGGGRTAVRNIHSGALYMTTTGRGMPKGLGLIARIEKIAQ